MLEKLDINLKFNNINPLLRVIKINESPIHTLNVYHATFNSETKNYLIGLPHIKRLRLYGMCEISTRDIINIGKYLINLEELSINFAGSLHVLRLIIQNTEKLTKKRMPLNTYYKMCKLFYDNI